MVTIRVADTNGASASQSFLLNVSPVNDPPTLDALADLRLLPNDSARTISLTGITPGPSNENQVVMISATSSDLTVVARPSITYTNPNTSGTLTITPVPGAYGSSTITVTVNDGQAQNNLFTRTFLVTVTQPPVISDLPDQTIDEDTPMVVNFTISDAETPAENLVVTAVSSNSGLVPAQNLVLSGSGSNRTLSLTPATNQFGTALITLFLRDGDGNVDQASFFLTVNSVLDVPILLTQPRSQSVTNGAPVVLQVVATVGLGSIQYQWQRNGVSLNGKTNANLILPAVQAADNGEYRVVVSAPEGSVVSAAAQVYALAPLQITSVTRSDSAIQISFPTVAGPTYVVEYKTSFTDTNWVLLESVTGTGEVVQVVDALGSGEGMRLYRLRAP
jgi:hypothetical protein